MGVFAKLKLLFRAKKPAEQLVGQVQELKRGWKKISFWISVVSTLLSLLGALSGVIPPNLSVIINTVLTAFYNVLRGLDKASEPGVRPPLQSTEFWHGILTEVSNIAVAVNGHVDPALLHSCEVAIAAIMAVVQNLGAQEPDIIIPKEPAPESTPPAA